MHYSASFLVCNHLEQEERELVALLFMSFGCLVTVNVLWIFFTVSWVDLQFVIVVFQLLTYLFTIPLPKSRLLLSADNLCKHVWSHIRTEKDGPDLDPTCLTLQ